MPTFLSSWLKSNEFYQLLQRLIWICILQIFVNEAQLIVLFNLSPHSCFRLRRGPCCSHNVITIINLLAIFHLSTSSVQHQLGTSHTFVHSHIHTFVHFVIIFCGSGAKSYNCLQFIVWLSAFCSANHRRWFCKFDSLLLLCCLSSTSSLYFVRIFMHWISCGFCAVITITNRCWQRCHRPPQLTVTLILVPLNVHLFLFCSFVWIVKVRKTNQIVYPWLLSMCDGIGVRGFGGRWWYLTFPTNTSFSTQPQHKSKFLTTWQRRGFSSLKRTFEKKKYFLQFDYTNKH